MACLTCWCGQHEKFRFFQKLTSNFNLFLRTVSSWACWLKGSLLRCGPRIKDVSQSKSPPLTLGGFPGDYTLNLILKLLKPLQSTSGGFRARQGEVQDPVLMMIDGEDPCADSRCQYSPCVPFHLYWRSVKPHRFKLIFWMIHLHQPLAIFHLTTDTFRLCDTQSDVWEQQFENCSWLCFAAPSLLQAFLAPQDQETLWVAGQPEKSFQESETESISVDQWVACSCVLCNELFQYLVNKNLV